MLTTTQLSSHPVTQVEHVLANLTRIVRAQYAARLGKSLEDMNDVPLEDLDFSELESSDGGSDSSVSDGPPKLPLMKKVFSGYHGNMFSGYHGNTCSYHGNT